MSSPETPENSQASQVQSLVGSLLLSPGSWSTQSFVCALQESLSPFLWKFCNQFPLAFKVKYPGDSQVPCRIPRWGNMLWDLELLQYCKNFFGIIVLQFVGHQLSGSMVGLVVTSSKRTYATHGASQVCYSLSPWSDTSPLLTHAFAGDTQTLKVKSGSVSVGYLGPGVHTRFCLSPRSISGGYGFLF